MKAKLVIDLGNSLTRFCVMYLGSNGKVSNKIHSSSNEFARLDSGYTVNERYRNSASTFYGYNGAVYAHGEIVDVEFGTTADRPSGTEKKYNSSLTDLAVRNALYVGLCDIAEEKGLFKSGSNVQEALRNLAVNVSWAITVLLPPGDVVRGREPLRDRLTGITSITTNTVDDDGNIVPENTIQINIDNRSDVNTFPEGLAAFIGAVMETDGSLREGVDPSVLKSLVLLVDIGSSTTDLCTVSSGQVVANSMYTINIGAREVINEMRRYLSSANEPWAGSRYSNKEVEDIVTRGYLTVGHNKKIDLTDEVNRIRHGVAERINKEMLGYFENAQYSANSVAYVLYAGGGSITPKGNGGNTGDGFEITAKLHSLSYYVHQSLKQHARYADVLEPPKDRSPRQLNIIGATIASLRGGFSD